MGLETCIDQQDLKAFALGHFDEDRSEAIAAHLSACARCEETMAGFDDTDDSMLAAVREAAGEAVSEPPSTPVEAVLQQIANPWSGADNAEKTASTGEWIRDYELLEPLGHGGMGTVYKAVHARLQRPVAIKLLPSRRLRDSDAVTRFEREMKAIGRLDHPAIVRATDAGEADGTHFLVMDYVDGIDLSQLIKLTGPMDVSSACEVIRQVATGLHYAHDQGLIHRDVKPSNLMMEVCPKDGNGNSTREKTAIVKLLDLGLALFGAASEAVDELTTVGQLMGTLDYMAPEQADDSHDVDARADVYSLGATMFKLLTGTAPYETSDRRTPLQKMKALATVDVPSVKTRRPTLPDEVVVIVDCMLLRDPASRFQTAADVAQAVGPFCGGHRLAELTQQAMEHRSQDALRDEPLSMPVESNKPARHQTEAAMAGMPDAVAVNKDVPVASRETSALSPPRRLITRSVMATLGILIFIAAGILIRIKTDSGTLIIESGSSDVPVEIRQGKDTVKQLTLLAGENKVTLHSGLYEIVLPAEFDSLTLDAGKFELSRGGEWIARISENAESLPIAIAADSAAESVKTDDLLPSQPASFSGPSVTPDVAQIILDPIRQVEFQRLRDRYAELLRKSDALQDSLNVEAVKLGDDHPRVRMFRDSMDAAQRQSEAVRAEMQEMLEIEQKIEEERALSAAKRAADAFNPAGTDTAQPLYAGKTFDQWLQLTQTERSPEELIKAVSALTALGNQGRQVAAVDAIFGIIERYPRVDEMNPTERKLFACSIHTVRGFQTATIVQAIKSHFATGRREAMSFVLNSDLSLLSASDTVTINKETVPLGNYFPLFNALSLDSEFVDMIVDPQRPFRDFGSTGQTILAVLEQHTIGRKPSVAVEAYLESLLVDPETLTDDDTFPPETVKSATILARCKPDVRYAKIFVRAIEDDIRNAVRRTGGQSNAPPLLTPHISPWQGLRTLRQAAEPALPLMYKILQGAPMPDGSLSAIDRVYRTSMFLENSDGEWIENIRGFEVNMRLLAVEVIASTGTKDPVALDLIRSELTSQFAAPQPDGSVEFSAGRNNLLIDGRHYGPAILPAGQGDDSLQYSSVRIEMANSCLLAWRALTNQTPRFATPSPNTFGNALPGSSNMRASQPRVLRYKGKTPNEWDQISDVSGMSAAEIFEVANMHWSNPDAKGTDFRWIEPVATALESAIETGDFLKESADGNRSDGDYWQETLKSLHRVAAERCQQAVTQGCQKATIDVRMKFFGIYVAAASDELLHSMMQPTSLSPIYEETLRQWTSLTPSQQTVLLRIEDRLTQRNNARTTPLLIQLLKDPDNVHRKKAAEILARLTNIPDDLRSEIIEVLMTAIDTSTTTQDVTGPVVAIARVAERGLSANILERLMFRVEEDSHHPDQLPKGVRVRFSDYSVYEYDRRTLLADLLGNYCVADQSIRDEFALRLLSLRSVLSFGDEPQPLKSLLGDRQIIESSEISVDSADLAFARSVKANVTRLVPTETDRARLLRKSLE